uniref:Uncharacterized protein n=1 Tax=Lactuca sativa TaxID=4236 RepID=A0A9R1VZI1_LACSA|nr:hypothetical protein LSAT_V11C400224840 [Lactuca sativa]
MAGRGRAFRTAVATKKAISRSSKASLQFPIGRISRFLKAGNLPKHCFMRAGKCPLAGVWALDTAAKPYEWRKLFATASARSNGLLLICGGRDTNSVVFVNARLHVSGGHLVVDAWWKTHQV